MGTRPATRVVASAQLAQDDYLELIRTSDRRTALCRYYDGAVRIAREFVIGSTRYCAADVRNGIPRQMLLPSAVSDYQSVEALVDEMIEVTCRYTGISDREAEKGAFFGLATFALNSFDPLPRAAITGSDRWQSAAYEKVLAGLCHQSLCVGNVTPAYLSSLPLGCTPSYVVGHPQPPASLVNLLETTQFGVSLTTAQGLTITPRFSAVIIDANNPRCPIPSSFLRIDSTQVSRTDPFDAEAARKLARLQNQLLSWHFDGLYLLRQKARAIGDFAGSTRAWASVITSFLPDTEQWDKRITEALSSQEQARLFDPSLESRAIVLDALLVLCHQNKSVVRIGDVSETANGILEMRGGGYQITDRRVGSITTNLGLRDPSDKRGNKGYKITLTTEVKRRIHEVGRSLNVPFFFMEDVEPCEFCKFTAPAQEQ